jgi:hypothetical protein
MSLENEWNGQLLAGQFVAMYLGDSGQAAPAQVPRPILAAAASGNNVCVIRPDQLGHFLVVHGRCVIACPNAARFHWVIREYLLVNGSTGGETLWAFSRHSRLHDLTLLDQLVRLATDGQGWPERRGLAKLTAKYCNLFKDERDIEKRFAAAATTPWEPIPPEVIRESINWACIVRDIYSRLLELAELLGGQPQGAPALPFGPLGLGLKVQGAIALDQARRIGIQLDTQLNGQLIEACNHTLDRSSDKLHGDHQACAAFQWDKRQIKSTADGALGCRPKALQDWLSSASRSLRTLSAMDFPAPMTPEGALSTDPNQWGVLADYQPELRAWAGAVAAAEARHLLGTPTCLLVAHPMYALYPMITSQKPNLEQLRRLIPSAVFRPRQGSVFLVVRLEDLPLRVLAAFLERRGQSRLAQAFRRGEDPYSTTAAALAEMDAAQFVQSKSNNAPLFSRWLTVAKGFLSAIPLRVGPEVARDMLAANAHTFMSATDAYKYYLRSIPELYPELSCYLPPFDQDLGRNWARGLTGRTYGFWTAGLFRAVEHLELAADALMAALWALVAADYRIVAVASWQVVLECPLMSAPVSAQAAVESLIKEATTKVLGGFPGGCASDWVAEW